jgi:hypothetical protein
MMLTLATTYYSDSFGLPAATKQAQPTKQDQLPKHEQPTRANTAPQAGGPKPHRAKKAGSGKRSPDRRSPYGGPNPYKDRLPRNSPESNLYFAIRAACWKGKDDAAALAKLLPTKECAGKNFEVWPRQHLLLHGLVKQGCVECVRYLLVNLKFDINRPRQKDGCRPLHICFYNLQGNRLDRMADLLVQLGANVEATNNYGEPPCMFVFKQSSMPARGFWMSKTTTSVKATSKTMATTRTPTGIKTSPLCIADLQLDTDLDTVDTCLELGPPATPTPTARDKGKMFTPDAGAEAISMDDSNSTDHAEADDGWVTVARKRKNQHHPAWTGKKSSSVQD